MGFDLTQVISDDKHYGAFVCMLCDSLVALDAVVTIPCSHPFCRDCMVDWAKKEIQDHRRTCTCPKCHQDLTANPNDSSNNNNSKKNGNSGSLLRVNDTTVLVLPLVEAQPLALQVLKLIQVSCVGDKKECEWKGDYGAWLQHAELHNHLSKYGSSQSFENKGGNQGHQLDMLPEGHMAANGEHVHVQGHRDIVLENGLHVNAQPPPPPPPPKPKIQRGHSSKAKRDSRVNSLKDMKRQYKSVSSLNYSPNNDDGSGGRSRSRSGKGSRSKTLDDLDEARTDLASILTNNSSDISRKVSNGAKSELAESQELETSYGEMDWNASLSSIQSSNIHNANNEQKQKQHRLPHSQSFRSNQFEPLNENISEEFSLDFEQEEHASAAPMSSEKATERSEKLKKQANAKFNKGDFEGARSLYSDGIDVMTSIITVTKSENELVATLFSNRAVTYFREKNFTKCIEDCNSALEYEPTYEKSYIRKWRALMALGNFEDACECLEEAHNKIPNSSRVKQELLKAREQKEVISVVNNMIDGGNLQQAKETIKPLARTSDNIGLLLVAAMADAGLGLTESALEKVNKALRFNPNHVEALQLRGLILFFSGDMEKGVRLLQELSYRHSDKNDIQKKLDQCQTTLSAFSKGRSYAKRSRYKEAVEQFTLAFEEDALPLPAGTALYCLLKIEKAEALLLSKQYKEALSDCLNAIESQPENAEAWALKAEIMICLGRAQEAKIELSEVRRTWGNDNYVIDDAYRKANFELKVKKVDDELLQLVNDIEAGVSEKVIIDGRDRYLKARSSKPNQSERHLNTNDKRPQMEKKPSSRSKSSFDQQKSFKTRRSQHKKDKYDKKSKREHHRRLGADGSGRTNFSRGQSSRTMNTQKSAATGGASSQDLLGASSATNNSTGGPSRRRGGDKKRPTRQHSKG